MIVWIEKSLALAIHERQLSEHGGSTGVRDEKLLESALARPQGLYASLHVKAAIPGRTSQKSHAYDDPAPDIADLAASLAYGLARNHPFVDGNKRTAHVCYRVFLALNDVEFDANDEDKYIAMMSLAEGTLREKAFAAWLRQHIKLKPGKRVQEPRARKYRVRG